MIQEPKGQRHCTSGPRNGRIYQVEYLDASGERRTWYGWIVETNLDYATKLFGHPLHPDDIIDAWRISSDVGPPVPTDPDEAGIALAQEVSDGSVSLLQTDAPAFNFHHFYRGVRERERLLGSATEAECRQWLITRPDSVFALATAIREQGSLPVRFLVLNECYRLFKTSSSEKNVSYVRELRGWLNAERSQLCEMIRKELSAIDNPADPEQVLQWFERQLQQWGDEQ